MPRGPGVRRSDLIAGCAGLLLSVAAAAAAGAVTECLTLAECSGEYRPFLGSGKEVFAVRGCLARDAGPLIDIKKLLRIYDPRWMPVAE